VDVLDVSSFNGAQLVDVLDVSSFSRDDRRVLLVTLLQWCASGGCPSYQAATRLRSKHTNLSGIWPMQQLAGFVTVACVWCMRRMCADSGSAAAAAAGEAGMLLQRCGQCHGPNQCQWHWFEFGTGLISWR
jgi:mono/diheme cytochrome c family protein